MHLDRFPGCGRDPRIALLRHLLTAVIFAILILIGISLDQTLVKELLERLLGRDQPTVVEHLVPEARIEQMQNRVFHPADVEINRHPIRFFRGRPRLLIIVRIDKAQIVPARSRPLWHRIGLTHPGAAIRQGDHQPLIAGTRQRVDHFGSSSLALRIGNRGQQHGQLIGGQGYQRAILHQHHGERFTPVTLAREEPIAQPVLDLTHAMPLGCQPVEHLRFGCGDR